MEIKNALLALAGLLVLAGAAFAFSGYYAPEKRAAFMSALANMSYADWTAAVNATGRTGILERVNETNFEDYKQMVGYEQKAAEIADKLGLGPREGGPRMMGRGMFEGKMNKDLQNSTYSEWVGNLTANGKSPEVLKYVNESNFDRFKQMHAYMASGDFQNAEEIRQELGLPAKGGMGRGHRMME